VGLFGREELIDRLARETGFVVMERQQGDYRVRPDDRSAIRSITIRCHDDYDMVGFQSVLPLRFPVATAPPELFRAILMRNCECPFAAWCIEVADACELTPYLHYEAIKAGLTGNLFARICRAMLDEREAFHGELRRQLGRMTVAVPERLARPPVAGGRSLPPGGGRGIVWVEG
jgi:hypothetical protein